MPHPETVSNCHIRTQVPRDCGASDSLDGPRGAQDGKVDVRQEFGRCLSRDSGCSSEQLLFHELTERLYAGTRLTSTASPCSCGKRTATVEPRTSSRHPGLPLAHSPPPHSTPHSHPGYLHPTLASERAGWHIPTRRYPELSNEELIQFLGQSSDPASLTFFFVVFDFSTDLILCVSLVYFQKADILMVPSRPGPAQAYRALARLSCATVSSCVPGVIPQPGK